MASVSQIISYATLIYPRTADISNANNIIILNQLMDEINNRLLRVRWENEPYEMYSISGQASYSLPTDCNPENVIKVLVSQDTSGNIDENTEWEDFEYVGILDNTSIDFGNYYTFLNNMVFLFKNGLPLQTTNLVIRLFYYREPTYMASTTDTPDVESKYHNLFKYGLIQNVACIGDNPDTDIADYWQKKFDEEMQIALRNLQDKFDSTPLKTRQTESYW